jgi:hypothetical protein
MPIPVRSWRAYRPATAPTLGDRSGRIAAIDVTHAAGTVRTWSSFSPWKPLHASIGQIRLMHLPHALPIATSSARVRRCPRVEADAGSGPPIADPKVDGTMRNFAITAITAIGIATAAATLAYTAEGGHGGSVAGGYALGGSGQGAPSSAV